MWVYFQQDQMGMDQEAVLNAHKTSTSPSVKEVFNRFSAYIEANHAGAMFIAHVSACVTPAYRFDRYKEQQHEITQA